MCVCVCVYIYIYIYVCISHFLIHSLIDGYLGCFHMLAIVNNAAVSTGVQVSAFNSFEYFPEVEWLHHIVILSLIFEEPPPCFPQWLHHFTFPPATAQLFQFLNILVNTCYLFLSSFFLPFLSSPLLSFPFLSVFLIVATLMGCEVVSHFGFDLHFSMISNV